MAGKDMFLGLHLVNPDDPLHEMVLLAVSLDRQKLVHMVEREGLRNAEIHPIKLYSCHDERVTELDPVSMEPGSLFFGYQRTTRSKTNGDRADVIQTLLTVDEHNASRVPIKVSHVPIELDTYYDEGVMNA